MPPDVRDSQASHIASDMYTVGHDKSHHMDSRHIDNTSHGLKGYTDITHRSGYERKHSSGNNIHICALLPNKFQLPAKPQI